MKKKSDNIQQDRIKRFLICNSKMREATLGSEKAFLKLAGNISTAQLQIILAIGDNTPCTMSGLAKVLHFSKANITQMVDRLIYKKYVKKVQSKLDKRVVEVQLLTKGQQVVRLNQEHVEQVAKQWFSKMTDEEQEMMLSFWEKYLNEADKN